MLCVWGQSRKGLSQLCRALHKVQMCVSATSSHPQSSDMIPQPVLLSDVLFALWMHPHVKSVRDAAARLAFCMHLFPGFMHTSDSSS